MTGQCSTVAKIKTSVIQGSGVGPSSYIITAGDLHPITPGNRLFKFADDIYLVVPEANTNTRTLEIAHIQAWAATNNLALNRSKSEEMIIRARGKRGKSACLQPPCSDIERVTTLRVLGDTVNNQLTSADHVTNVLASCNSLLYALRVLRNHGISDTSLYDVFRATIVAKLTYAVPAWSGACSAGDHAKLDAFVKRCRRLGYCSQNEPSLTLTQLMDDADERLFRSIINNIEHVLQPFLPDRPVLSYNLRRRPHCNKSLITKTADLSNNDYIIRATYRDSYRHYS